MTRILIADDEPVILKVLGKFLKKAGREIFLATSAAEALDLARRHAPLDVALLDKNLGDGSGLAVARELKKMQEDLAVILVTGYASLQSAIEAVQIGAYDYLSKPIDDPASLDLRVTNAEERVRLARERRALAIALAESEERYHSIFETSPDAIVLFEPGSGRIRDANRAAEQAFAREGGLAGVDVADLFAAPSPAQLTQTGGPPVTGRRGDGSTFEAEICPGTLTLRGEELRTLAVRDVSARERLARERSQVEDQLRQAQKMDAIGRLAGGLGHDLGNMLAVVMTYVELLRDGAEGAVREDLEMAQVAAERAAQLVRQLMTLARHGPGTPATVSVNEGVAETVKLLRHSLPEDVALRTELGPEPWLTLLDPSQLAQVLINLCVNARDAMPGGGQLTIATANLAAEASRPPGVPPGAWVMLSVRDTGIGMSAEVRNRVFEPFFTTKEAGKGTGLGLSVVYGIVRQAGGFVAVESAPGQGTTFRLGFPRAAGAATPRRAAEPGRGEPSGHGQTVLVAEDDVAVRATVVHSLTVAGFRVLEGESADAALAAARSHRGSIDLLLTDFVMPGQTGAQLAEALRHDRPAVKVLFMTGFPGDPRVAEALSGTAATASSEVLQKPFKHSTLVEQVRRVLVGCFCLIVSILGPVPALAQASPTRDAASPERVRMQFTDRAIGLNLTDEEHAWLAAHDPIRVGMDPDHAPYEWIDRDGHNVGMAVDYIRLLENTLGVRFEIAQGISWAEVLDMTKRGELDIVTSIVETPERSRYLTFSAPYRYTQTIIIDNGQGGFVGSLERLAGKRVSVEEGYFTQEFLKKDHPRIQLVLAHNTKEALTLVADSKVDAYVGDAGATSYAMKTYGLLGLRFSGQTEYLSQHSFAFTKGNTVLASIVAKAMATIPKEEADVIFERWRGPKIERGVRAETLVKYGTVWVLLSLLFGYWVYRLRREIGHRKAAETRLASIAVEQGIDAERLRESEALYRLLTEDVSDVVWKTDPDLRITYISPVDERVRGYRADEVIGHHVFEMFTEEGVATVKELVRKRHEAEQQGAQTGPSTFEVQHRLKDGSFLWAEVQAKPERDASGAISGYHGITRVTTERKRMQDQVRQLAFYDPLTTLANRRLLDDRLSQALAASKRTGRHGAVMFLDLDKFKALNDTHGHDVGDLLLVEVARRLKGCVRETDTVARMGGDEFVVMLSDLNEDGVESASQAGMVAEKVRMALSEPCFLSIQHAGGEEATVEYHCTASVGVAVFIGQESQGDVLKWADSAMYEAKEAGRNLVRIHGPPCGIPGSRDGRWYPLGESPVIALKHDEKC